MTITRRDVLRSMLALPVAVAGAKVVGASTALAKVPASHRGRTYEASKVKFKIDGKELKGFADGDIIRIPGELDAQLRARVNASLPGTKAYIAAKVAALPWVQAVHIFDGPGPWAATAAIWPEDGVSFMPDMVGNVNRNVEGFECQIELARTLWYNTSAGMKWHVVCGEYVGELHSYADFDDDDALSSFSVWLEHTE